jgi:hypothetical protein
MLRDEQIEVLIGRCQGSDGKIENFMQVIHRPTGIQRYEVPIRSKNQRELERRLRSEIEAELIAKGLTQYILNPEP